VSGGAPGEEIQHGALVVTHAPRKIGGLLAVWSI